ncbi:extracellular solute-binding protein [Halorarius litoreus]|uniref:extracellular solute-binding protein n=1 Tax=Halorarius litoreus TaxID=2962676 RepID=UPI0020CD34B3|nr:extracellular solute-binding protein [Halorarius litoreus]
MDSDDRSATRRRYLVAAGTAGLTGLAGCNGLLGNGTETPSGTNETGGGESEPEQIGSGREGRELTGGVPMAELPDLAGELDIYSGRGEALVGELVEFIDDMYPDLTLRVRYGSSTDLVNKILTEGDNSPADVFYSVNAGALGALAERDRATPLPDRVLDFVGEEFRDPDGRWIGTSGRARSIPYNTDQFSASDIPTDVFAFPDAERFAGNIGWTPVYGSFQAFVTAMRILNGRAETKAWLEGMLDANVQSYNDEFTLTQAVADGEIGAGFANHYYSLRVLDARPNAPLDLAFTDGDAGSIFNVAGAAAVDTANDSELAANFVMHLLSAEAQDYFATTTFEYPLVADVEPVQPGSIELPTIDELNPPQGLNLSQLADIGPTLELMREVGLNV